MNEHITALEGKVAQVVTLYEALRAENLSLQSKLESATSEHADLTKRLDTARERLEKLLKQLPDA